MSVGCHRRKKSRLPASSRLSKHLRTEPVTVENGPLPVMYAPPMELPSPVSSQTVSYYTPLSPSPSSLQPSPSYIPLPGTPLVGPGSPSELTPGQTSPLVDNGTATEGVAVATASVSAPATPISANPVAGASRGPSFPGHEIMVVTAVICGIAVLAAIGCCGCLCFFRRREAVRNRQVSSDSVTGPLLAQHISEPSRRGQPRAGNLSALGREIPHTDEKRFGQDEPPNVGAFHRWLRNVPTVRRKARLIRGSQVGPPLKSILKKRSGSHSTIAQRGPSRPLAQIVDIDQIGPQLSAEVAVISPRPSPSPSVIPPKAPPPSWRGSSSSPMPPMPEHSPTRFEQRTLRTRREAQRANHANLRALQSPTRSAYHDQFLQPASPAAASLQRSDSATRTDPNFGRKRLSFRRLSTMLTSSIPNDLMSVVRLSSSGDPTTMVKSEDAEDTVRTPNFPFSDPVTSPDPIRGQDWINPFNRFHSLSEARAELETSRSVTEDTGDTKHNATSLTRSSASNSAQLHSDPANTTQPTLTATSLSDSLAQSRPASNDITDAAEVLRANKVIPMQATTLPSGRILSAVRGSAMTADQRARTTSSLSGRAVPKSQIMVQDRPHTDGADCIYHTRRSLISSADCRPGSFLEHWKNHFSQVSLETGTDEARKRGTQEAGMTIATQGAPKSPWNTDSSAENSTSQQQQWELNTEEIGKERKGLFLVSQTPRHANPTAAEGDGIAVSAGNEIHATPKSAPSGSQASKARLSLYKAVVSSSVARSRAQEQTKASIFTSTATPQRPQYPMAQDSPSDYGEQASWAGNHATPRGGRVSPSIAQMSPPDISKLLKDITSDDKVAQPSQISIQQDPRPSAGDKQPRILPRTSSLRRDSEDKRLSASDSRRGEKLHEVVSTARTLSSDGRESTHERAVAGVSDGERTHNHLGRVSDGYGGFEVMSGLSSLIHKSSQSSQSSTVRSRDGARRAGTLDLSLKLQDPRPKSSPDLNKELPPTPPFTPGTGIAWPTRSLRNLQAPLSDRETSPLTPVSTWEWNSRHSFASNRQSVATQTDPPSKVLTVTPSRERVSSEGKVSFDVARRGATSKKRPRTDSDKRQKTDASSTTTYPSSLTGYSSRERMSSQAASVNGQGRRYGKESIRRQLSSTSMERARSAELASSRQEPDTKQYGSSPLLTSSPSFQLRPFSLCQPRKTSAGAHQWSTAPYDANLLRSSSSVASSLAQSRPRSPVTPGEAIPAPISVSGMVGSASAASLTPRFATDVGPSNDVGKSSSSGSAALHAPSKTARERSLQIRDVIAALHLSSIQENVSSRQAAESARTATAASLMGPPLHPSTKAEAEATRHRALADVNNFNSLQGLGLSLLSPQLPSTATSPFLAPPLSTPLPSPKLSTIETWSRSTSPTLKSLNSFPNLASQQRDRAGATAVQPQQSSRSKSGFPYYPASTSGIISTMAGQSITAPAPTSVGMTTTWSAPSVGSSTFGTSSNATSSSTRQSGDQWRHRLAPHRRSAVVPPHVNGQATAPLRLRRAI